MARREEGGAREAKHRGSAWAVAPQVKDGRGGWPRWHEEVHSSFAEYRQIGFFLVLTRNGENPVSGGGSRL